MDTDSNPLSHYIAVGVVATFPGLRRFIGIMCLLGVAGAGLFAILASRPDSTVVNPNPVCNRVAYQVISENMPPRAWGPYTESIGTHPAFYVKEAHGTGWCLTKHDISRDSIVTIPTKTPDGRTVGVYNYKWYEVPSKYGENVQIIAKPDDTYRVLAWLLGAVSLMVLFGLWVPATIAAMVAKRWAKNIREMDDEED